MSDIRPSGMDFKGADFLRSADILLLNKKSPLFCGKNETWSLAFAKFRIGTNANDLVLHPLPADQESASANLADCMADIFTAIVMISRLIRWPLELASLVL